MRVEPEKLLYFNRSHKKVQAVSGQLYEKWRKTQGATVRKKPMERRGEGRRAQIGRQVGDNRVAAANDSGAVRACFRASTYVKIGIYSVSEEA